MASSYAYNVELNERRLLKLIERGEKGILRKIIQSISLPPKSLDALEEKAAEKPELIPLLHLARTKA